MPRATEIIKKGGIIFLPVSTTYPVWRVVIDGTDVTNDVITCKIRLIATERLSSATLVLENNKGRYNTNWDPTANSHTIDIYVEYSDADNYKSVTPTNRLFSGKLDSAKPGLTNEGWTMDLVARDRPELNDMTTTLTFDNTNIDDALKIVIDDINLVTGETIISYTSSTIESTAVKTSTSYRDQKYIGILTDLAERANFDFRIDPDGVFNAFARGSKTSQREIIASGNNLLAVAPAGYDATEARNFVKVYGPEKEGCLIVHTKKSSVFQPWRKDLIMNDTSNQNLAQVKDRAEKEYENKKDVELVASPTCLGLPNLKVGETVKTLIAHCELNGDFVAQQIIHTLSMNGYDSQVTLSELEKDGLRTIKDNERDIRQRSTFNNPNNMETSYHFTFENDDNVSTHSSTETSNGKLVISSGDSGIMVSQRLTVDNTITQLELRYNGNDDCDICSFRVSADDGNNFDSITPGTKGEPGEIINIAQSGKKLVVEVTLKSNSANTDPAIESLVLLGK